MSRAAVIGDPVDRSLSPDIFRIASRELNHPIDYRKILVVSDELSTFFSEESSNYLGWNVTIPHKQTIVPLINGLSKEAQAIGAVNVVKLGETTVGYNTDYLGVIETIKEQGIDLPDQSALIYGAGGAARAAAYACLEMGAKNVYVYNRTTSRAVNLCSELKSSRLVPAPTIDQVTSAISVLINTVPVFDEPTYYQLPQNLAPNCLAFDTLYQQEQTLFLDATSALTQINGLDMLIWQALYTWEIWIGEINDKTTLKGIIKKEIIDG